VPAPIIAVVDHALAFDKHARFASARQMQEALRAAQQTATSAPTMISAGHPAAHDATAAQAPTDVLSHRDPADAPTAVLGHHAAAAERPGPAQPRSRASTALPFVFLGFAVVAIGLLLATGVGISAWTVTNEPPSSAPVAVKHAAGDPYEQMPLEKIRKGSVNGEDGPYFNKHVITTGIVRSVHSDPDFTQLVLGEGDGPWVGCWTSKPIDVAVGTRITVRGQVISFDTGKNLVPIGSCERVK
jgi:hypothetical protein